MFGRAALAKRTRRAAALGAVGLGACALLAACSPVKMGAAAVVGDQRITVASLDTQVSNLQAAAAPYGSALGLTTAEMPTDVLTWLIRFSIIDQLATANGISVTQAEVQQGLSEIESEASEDAEEDGFSSGQALLVGNGVTPQMEPALGQWVAQQNAYDAKVNGGKLPTTTAQDNTVTAKFTKAECSAAKSLSIEVSPQFGRLDYSEYSVVAAANTLSAPEGTPSAASTTGLTPAC